MKAAIAGANVPGKAKYWKIGLFRENPILIGIPIVPRLMKRL